MSFSDPKWSLSRRQLLGGLGVCAATSLFPESTRAASSPLEKAFDDLVAKSGISEKGPGVAVLVRRPGKVILERCTGLAQLANPKPVTPKTLFYLASVSKSFTAAAILLLHDRGKLSLLEDVRKYIPEFPVYDRAHPIRVTDLLQHVSGLRDYLAFQNVPARNRDYWVGEDYIAELARGVNRHPLRFPTGQMYSYCNTNYIVLAAVVARVSGKTFGTFLHEELFAPTGMKNTFVFETPNSLPKHLTPEHIRAIGYNKVSGKWSPSWGTPPDLNETHLAVGDGGIWSNLEDMAAWDDALRSHKLIKPITMHMALVPSETTDGKVNHYGRGWSLYFNDNSGSLIGYGHNGVWNGFRLSYYRYLLADRTSIILSNCGEFEPSKFWYPLNNLIDEYDRNPGGKSGAGM